MEGVARDCWVAWEADRGSRVRILITGNLGYVGSVLVEHLAAVHPEAQLVGLDLGWFAHALAGADPLPERWLAEQRFGDVRKVRTRDVEGFDSVVHLATTPGLHIAEQAKRAGVRGFLLVQPVRDVESGLAELADPRFTVTVLRFATPYGYSPRLRLDVGLNEFIASEVEHGCSELPQDLTSWSPTIHVRDMARAIDWALERGQDCGAFRVVDGCPDAPAFAPREDPREAILELATALRRLVPFDRTRFSRQVSRNRLVAGGALDDDLAWRTGKCRVCGMGLGPVVIDLGDTALANSYVEPDDAACEPTYPLRVRLCTACKLVQLDRVVRPELIFSHYSYLSSFSSLGLEHARVFCGAAIGRLGLGRESRVIEVASNDGYLLRNFVAAGVPCLGVEPAANVAERARQSGIPTLVRFFGRDVAEEIVRDSGQADLVVANNVLAHVPTPNCFVSGLRRLLKPDGAISLEFPHLLELMRQAEFDTIYHEHYFYFSLLAVEHLLSRHRLRAFDVEQLNTHGGSLRLWVCREESARFAQGDSLGRIRRAELDACLDRPESYQSLATQAEAIRSGLAALLDRLHAEGKSVAAYGAAAKGNTLLNYCDLGPDRIRFVADRSPLKQGRLLPGTHIPIVEPKAVFEQRPDYLLILAWNLDKEIREQMRGIEDWGGQFLSVKGAA